MSGSSTRQNRRPRELRRRVMLPARMRTPAGWSDARILNVSSRGLMVHANFSALECGEVEVWHRDLAISARIVWRNGRKAGLQADETIPVDQILCLSQSPSLQLGTERYHGVERRKRPRGHEASRVQARILEFASVAVIAAALALGFSFCVSEALAEPMATVRIALGG